MLPQRTITTAAMSLFSSLSSTTNPIHWSNPHKSPPGVPHPCFPTITTESMDAWKDTLSPPRMTEPLVIR